MSSRSTEWAQNKRTLERAKFYETFYKAQHTIIITNYNADKIRELTVKRDFLSLVLTTDIEDYIWVSKKGAYKKHTGRPTELETDIACIMRGRGWSEERARAYIDYQASEVIPFALLTTELNAAIEWYNSYGVYYTIF